MRHPTFLTLGMAILAGTLQAQSITRLTPEAAAPGDLLIIDGTDLTGVTAVRFTAAVGGFIGFWTATPTPVSVSATEVRVVVPTMASFAPPGASPPGVPVGGVAVVTGAGPSAPASLFYLQATPAIDTLGIGTTQSTGQGRPVASFLISGGPPVPGNAGFVLRLENAAPGQDALLAVGVPSPGPLIPFGDGLFVVDVHVPFLLFQPFGIDAQGDVSLPAAIPSPAIGLSIVVQWALRDPNTNAFVVSNGLTFVL